MTTWGRKTGDVGNTIRVELSGVASLTGATAVTAQVWPELRTNATRTTLTGSVIDSTERIVEITLGSWLATARPGRYHLVTKVAFGAGLSLTWPELNTDTIEVGE